MEVLQKAVEAARLAAKSAQEKQQAEKDAEMPSPRTAEERPDTAHGTTEAGPEVFDDCDVDATVEELRKSNSLDAFGSNDGSPDRGKVRRFMEAVCRGTRRRIG
jgi:hypothetical protein